ncbi:hypothetical protein BV22DRAFT_1121322 [Leucogyrophana mollusca]|uniref:Uncharacterized protein n=1 Tax=Leucogyrophana mollusca TaxID=85980 RepID=A0ACB8BAG7_9AGAM|nr:hypothetical protein BV22DRAFT_1121322 [Leucogyrophana mollusca]
MSPAAPRWLTALSTALEKEAKVPKHLGGVFQLATIDPGPPPTARVRSCIHRELLTSAKSPALPLLLTTTDIRTPKVAQLGANDRAEGVFWTESTQEQFRVTGRAALVPSPTEERGPKVEATVMGADYDWEAKRRAVFDSLSGHMRASWCRPTPGTPLASYDDAKEWPETVPRLSEAESESDKRNVQTALGNFALVIIEPTEVDYVELGSVPQRRTRFVWKGEGEGWAEQIVVP